MLKSTQAQTNHMGNQVSTLTSDNFIPKIVSYPLPVVFDSKFERKQKSTKFGLNDFMRRDNNQIQQLTNRERGRRKSSKLTRQTKIERRVNPILLPLRILIDLLRIITLPLRILLAPLIILLRAIVEILARLIGLLLFFINPFFFIFVGFQIFNIARIVASILRIIFNRIFRRREHEKREERNVTVITLTEEEEDHVIHHPWPIPIKKLQPKKQGKRHRNELNIASSHLAAMDQFFPGMNADSRKFTANNMMQLDYKLFHTGRHINPAQHFPRIMFDQQLSQASNLLPK